MSLADLALDIFCDVFSEEVFDLLLLNDYFNGYIVMKILKPWFPIDPSRPS